MKKEFGILRVLLTLVGAFVFVAGVVVLVLKLMNRFCPELFYGGECCCDEEDWDGDWDDDWEDDDEEEEEEADEDGEEEAEA